MRHTHMAARALAAGTLLAVGCAPSARVRRLRPAEPGVVETLLALGTPRETPGVEGARTLARAALKNGLRGTAEEATRLWLDRARMSHALAQALGDDAAAEDARAQWQAVRKEAAEVARALDAPWLLLRAWDEEGGDPAALAWAVARLTWLPPHRCGRLQPLLAEQPAALAALERACRARSTATPAQLAGLGLDALDLLEGRLVGLAEEGEQEAVWEVASALRALDPWHLPARLALLLRQELAGGVLQARPGLLEDVLLVHPSGPGWTDVGRIARLLRERERAPRGAAVPLALALRALYAGLTGDAAALAGRVLAREDAPAEAHALAEALAAAAALAGGDVAAWEAWVEAHGAADSPRLRALASRLEHDEAPEELRAYAARARRWLFRRVRPPGWDERLASLTDPDLPAAERWEAVHELARTQPALGLPVGLCLAEGRADCEELLDAAAALDNPDDGTEEHILQGLEAFAGLAGTPERWLLAASYLPAGRSEQVLGALDGQADTARAASASYVTGRLTGLLGAGRADEARAELERAGRVLGPAWRLAARLAIRDLREGRLTGQEAIGAFQARWPFPGQVLPIPREVSPEHRAELVERHSGDSHSARLGRGLALLHEGAVGEAVGLLRPLLGLVRGPEATELAAWVATAAHLAGDEAAARAARTQIEELAPGSFHARFLAGWLAPEDDPRRGLDALAAALVARPSSAAAFRLLATRLAEVWQGPEGAARVRELLAAVGPVQSAGFQLVDRPAVVEAASGRELVAVMDAWWDEAGALELARAGRADDATRLAAVQELEGYIRTTDGPARALAAEAAALLAATDAATDRAGQLAWLLFLAGDGDRAVALGAAGEEAPLDPWFPAVLLGTGRRGPVPVIDDELALALWRGHNGWPRDPVPSVQKLAERPGLGRELRQVLCRVYVDANLTDLALDPCWSAVADGPVDPDLAAAVSWLLLERPEDLSRRGLDPARFFAETAPRLTHPRDATWLANQAVWLLGEGRDEEAARLLADAWAEGFDVQPHPPDDDATSRYRPWLGLPLRLIDRLATPDGEETLLLAQATTTSLLGGDLEAAVAYAAAARRWGVRATGTGFGQMAWFVPDFVALIEHDLTLGRLDEEGLGLVRLALARQETGPEELAPLAERYPTSDVVAYLLLEGAYVRGRHQATPELVRRLTTAHPDNASVVLFAVGALHARGETDRARELLERCRSSRPDDPRLTRIRLPGPSGTGAALPGWLTDPAALDARLAAIPAEAVAALEPVRLAAPARAAEAFFPSDWEPSLLDSESYVSPEGVTVSVLDLARPSRCEPRACLQRILPALRRKGLRILWQRETTLPAGPAAEALGTGPGGAALLAVVPAGGRVFLLEAGGPVEHLEGGLPALALLRETFRPLDLVLGPSQAEVVRERAWGMPDAGVRREARRVLAAGGGGSGCPVAALLQELPTLAARGALLLDLYLTVGDVAGRRALLTCTPPEEEAAEALALVTLLEEDDALHRFGRAAVARFPRRARGDAEAVLLGWDEVPVSGQRPSLAARPPPHGVLEVLAALPEEERRAFSEALLRSTDPRQHALGLAAGAVAVGAVPGELLAAEIRSAPPGIAGFGALAARQGPSQAALAALRARLDALGTPAGPAELYLASIIAEGLAARLDPRDATRLQGLARRLADSVGEDADERRRRASAWLDVVAGAHARGLELLGGSAGRRDARVDWLALRWTARHRRGGGDRGSPVPAADLLTQPLPRLLRGDRWTYARIARPGLLGAAARDLHARLEADSAPETFSARRTLRSLAEAHGAGLLGEGGGLDLDRPIECASPRDRRAGFVCTAWVKDATAVRNALARRTLHHDAGVALPVRLATTGASLPLLLAGLPALLQTAFYARPAGPAGGRLVAERVRSTAEVGGRTLERYAVVELRDGEGAAVDAELYLFDGSRLFVLAPVELAREVLLDLPAWRDSFLGSKRFAAASRDWTDAAALQALTVAGASPLSREDTALALALDAGGAGLRASVRLGAPPGDVRAVRSRLPEGATATLALALGGGRPGDARELELPQPTEAVGPRPPTWLLASGAPCAFGWYSRPGQPLWARWVAVLDLGGGGREAWTGRGGPLPDAAEREVDKHEGWSVGRDGEHLVVGSSEDLVLAALNRRPAAAEPSGPAVAVLGELSSPAAAAWLRALAEGLPGGDDRAGHARFLATLLAASRGASLRGAWDAAGERLLVQARLDVRLAPPGTELEVLGRLLAAPLRNALRLPREVRAPELEGPLELVLEVDDAAEVARRLVPRGSRVEVEVVDAGQLRLRVAPGPRLGQRSPPEPLPAARRRRALAAEPQLPVQSAELRRLAREVTGGTSSAPVAATRVVGWVHERLTYELTPESLDVSEVLARRRGDCTEHALLAVALLRAAGTPAEVRQGLHLSGNELVAHAWAAFYDGTSWREVEPTEGRPWVGAGHVELSVPDFLALVSLGGLRVTSVSAAPPGPAAP